MGDPMKDADPPVATCAGEETGRDRNLVPLQSAQRQSPYMIMVVHPACGVWSISALFGSAGGSGSLRFD